MMSKQEHEVGSQLVIRVRTALVARGSSLSAWCEEQGICRSWAYEVLNGHRNGPQAQALRKRLIRIAAASYKHAA